MAKKIKAAGQKETRGAVPKTPKKTRDPMHSLEAVAERLKGSAFKTTVEIAADLGVTKTTAQTYLKNLGASRKLLETGTVRQGKRGPEAVGFRIRVR